MGFMGDGYICFVCTLFLEILVSNLFEIMFKLPDLLIFSRDFMSGGLDEAEDILLQLPVARGQSLNQALHHQYLKPACPISGLANTVFILT